MFWRYLCMIYSEIKSTRPEAERLEEPGNRSKYLEKLWEEQSLKKKQVLLFNSYFRLEKQTFTNYQIKNDIKCFIQDIKKKKMS